MNRPQDDGARPGIPSAVAAPLPTRLPSPFTAEPPSSPVVSEVGALEPAVVEEVERIEKPWGHEEVFGVLEGRYAGKVLHIKAGAALSLQWHLHKDETISVRSGQVTVEYGDDARRLVPLSLNPGQRLLVRAGMVHRITAVVDSQVLEVSTAWPGWRADVVRIEDGYGRTGTTAP